MAGRLRLLAVGTTSDGLRVEATFELLRENRPGLQVRQVFDRNATQAEIVAGLTAECARQAAAEPAPALVTLQELFPAGQVRTIVDPVAPPPAGEGQGDS